MDLPRIPEIDDATLQDSAPRVRALVVHRLEEVWRACTPYMGPRPVFNDIGEEVDRRPPDPRFVEAGIRVLDRLMRLYRLDSPGIVAAELGADTDLVAEVDKTLQELEQRLGSS